MAAHPKKQNAILLIGPTGSGKTPLGNFMEKKSWQGRRCRHFDFGENLRRIAVGRSSSMFNRKETAFIRDILSSGALLKDKDFLVAAKTLKYFIKKKRVKPDDFIILNGLPRHTGQAKVMAKTVDIKMLISLVSSPETILKRIKTNAGGDRKGRTDDNIESVAKKLELFRKHTVSLIEYYRKLGVKIASVTVSARTKPKNILNTLEQEQNRL
ncbi:MAG: nucleoside monophosphate kinase [Planctomycetes bacterium]|nr:nucleoside monophosphate kinase [Planctomycetota bacterium]